MRLALFDLDHTLLPLDSDTEWARFLVRLGVVEAGHHEAENERFARAYRDGTLNIYEWLDFQLAPLTRYPVAELDDMHARFMQEVINPAITPAARSLVDRHRDQGDLCALVTATNEFVTAPIARAFGFGADALLATGIERVGDRYTGKPRGLPCFRDGKITNTEQWLAARGMGWASFKQSWFYSDSANDLPLLQKVSDPVATNPDPRLAAHAAQAGWPVLRLFA